MNSRANYTLVGMVVVAIVTVMMLFVYWMLKPSDERVMQPYLIYFTESVSGLNIDSPVKFRGITVGKVERMRINPKNSEEIEIRISVQDDTPIKIDTVATLVPQGITGLRFIDLSLGSKNAPDLKPTNENEYAVIASSPSFFERFESTISTLGKRLASVLERTEQLLDESNQKAFSAILENSASVMGRMERVLSDENIKEFETLMAKSASASAQLDAMMPKLEALADNGVELEQSLKTSLQSIAQSYKEVGAAMESFRRLNDAGHYSVKNSMEEPMHVFKVTMAKMQELFLKIEAALEQFERSPSDLLFKKETLQKGPGEE